LQYLWCRYYDTLDACIVIPILWNLWCLYSDNHITLMPILWYKLKCLYCSSYLSLHGATDLWPILIIESQWEFICAVFKNNTYNVLDGLLFWIFQHHCRNCGDIYCNECSDQKMPLPSSARPVRVCDSCQTLLLRRYSANWNLSKRLPCDTYSGFSMSGWRCWPFSYTNLLTSRVIRIFN